MAQKDIRWSGKSSNRFASASPLDLTFHPQADIRQMLPSDIGAAAAYESWRCWRFHYGIMAQPLSGDRERQREALIGLAVAEGLLPCSSSRFSMHSQHFLCLASRLYTFTGRVGDTTGRLQSCETAASTATRIYTETVGYDYNPSYKSSMHSRSASPSSLDAQYADHKDPGLSDERTSSLDTGGPGMLSDKGSAMPVPPSPTISAYGPF